jgi:hypothetical protein
MTAPTPILDSADARYVELAAFIAMQPGWRGPAIEAMTADERAAAHSYFVYGEGNDERDGVDPDADAALTVISILRIMHGDVPDRAGDPQGDQALSRMLERFEGREHLLFEQAMGYVDFLHAALLGARGEEVLRLIDVYRQGLERDLGRDD